MRTLSFEWDPQKDSSNKRKHGVSFSEARTAFFDENARVLPDPDHSGDEERFVLLGLSTALRVLVVCHCYRQADQLVRIISARRANLQETKQYQWWLK